MSDYFLADDLSGALDAAAAFHHAGRRVIVALSPDTFPTMSAADVVGITTETRNASATAAAASVTAAIAHGRARGARLLYKKIDSTLRGQVAAEVAALAAAMPHATILFCPANPNVGRTVRDGLLLVHGVPVANTDFARDPVSPVRESSIRSLLRDIAGSRLIIADAETEEELSAVVARLEASGTEWIAVGSGALARPVAALHARGDLQSVKADPVPSDGPVLFVCGSANPANRAQAERLVAAYGVQLREISLSDSRSHVTAALEDLRRFGVAALAIGATRIDSATALHAIVTAARTVITEASFVRVFVTGGETAFALCRELDISALRFHAEIEPGLSVSSAAPPPGPMLLAVKNGGFGDEHTWLRAMNALRGSFERFG